MPETIRSRTSGATRARQMHQILYQKAVFQGAFLGPSNKEGPPAPLYFPSLSGRRLSGLQNCKTSLIVFVLSVLCSTLQCSRNTLDATLRESLSRRGRVVLKNFRRHGTVSSNQIFAMIKS